LVTGSVSNIHNIRKLCHGQEKEKEKQIISYTVSKRESEVNMKRSRLSRRNPSGKKIFRLIMADAKGKIVGYQLVEGKSADEIMKKPKSEFVGRDRTIVGVLPTKLKGTLEERAGIPRSRRFGKGYR
jgi:hypothetical protein